MAAPGYVHPSKRSLTAETLEKYQSLATTGATASIVLDQVRPMLDTRREQVIGEALAAYRTMGMTDAMALRFWAILSEVAALKEQLTHDEDAGIKAYAQLLEGSDNGR